MHQNFYRREWRYFCKSTNKKILWFRKSRPAIILFHQSVPFKAYCECPVGRSGLCCHVLAVLLFLKHFTDTKEKFLELTCTQQLQTLHRRSTKGSIPMVPLRQIKLKSAKAKKSLVHDLKIMPADPKQSTFKRDVLQMKQVMQEKLRKMDMPYEKHCYNVLTKSNTGKKTSLMDHLQYRYTLMSAHCLADHDYCTNLTFNKCIIEPDMLKIKNVETYIDRATSEKHTSTTYNIINQNITEELNNTDIAIPLVYDDIQSQLSNKIININLQNLHPKNPLQYQNHVNVAQNTEDWQELRKRKVTGSRLPALIGVYGKKKFDLYWKIVLEGLQEKDVLNNNFHNFDRGHNFEAEALEYFRKETGCGAITCGFFNHNTDSNYGASPDALVAPGILLEIKTRAANSMGPLTSISTAYYVQAQLQMVCTDSDFCILMSYHPESKTAKYFLIRQNNFVWSAIKILADSILSKTPISEWQLKEDKTLANIEKNVIHRVPDFASMKPLRSYINKVVALVPNIIFTSLAE